MQVVPTDKTVGRGAATTCFIEIKKLLQTAWAGHIQLDVWAAPYLPPLACDPLALQSAVLNLLFNARDAMPDGGVISLRAEAIWSDAGERIELRVVDSGVGMTADTITRAFEPFFTTKPNGLGGVGLPMVQRFAREAGGRVLIESEYGVGTTVRLQLPASLQPAEISVAPPETRVS
jgi:signal transduction histidine kinase